MAEEVANLEQMLDRMAEAPDDSERVSVARIVEAVGSRSFGPLLLVAGLLLVSPLSGIPGLPTVTGLLVFLIAVQLLLRKRHFWLPQWLLKRSISRRRFCKVLGWMRPSARIIDRGLRPRMFLLIQGAGAYAAAVICLLIAAGLPLMEVVPFSATAAGLALTAFGLALIAHDGLVALVAFAVTGSIIALLAWQMFGP